MLSRRQYFSLCAIGALLSFWSFLSTPARSLRPIQERSSCVPAYRQTLHEVASPDSAYRVGYYQPCRAEHMLPLQLGLAHHTEAYPALGNLPPSPLFPRSIVWHGPRHVHIEAFVCAAADLPTTELWRDSVRVTLTPLIHDATYPAAHALTKACAGREGPTVASAAGR